MERLDRWLASLAPLLFILIGVSMIVVAAAAGLADSVAIAFAVLGTGLLVFGGLTHLMEGPFEIGPQKVKGQLALRVRVASALEATADASPEVREVVEDVVELIVPETLPSLTTQYRNEIKALPPYRLSASQRQAITDATKGIFSPTDMAKFRELQRSIAKLGTMIPPVGPADVPGDEEQPEIDPEPDEPT